jgi:hypothetical protein
MLRGLLIWWAPRLRAVAAGVVQLLRDWILPVLARVIGALLRSLAWRARLSFARRAPLVKGLYLIVALYIFGVLADDVGARSLARTCVHAAVTLVSVLAAAALIKLIWVKFTEEDAGLRS